jgi:cell fate regulator YaaT (PSP1 superfamily)
VRFRYSKTIWFDPAELDPPPAVGDRVVVNTERGTELGEVTMAVSEVTDEELPAPLKPLLRIATDEDCAVADELCAREREALPVFRELIDKNEVDMKPVDVEILHGEEKMIFYFSAEERVDFRALVRDLAAHFHTRIDMRQVGVRDEARMIGGLGHCGEALCCARMGGDFLPVSIKMAKEQGLPLNPAKISGLCGRLMCCLRYEVEAYKDFTKRAPRRGTMVETPRGEGKIVELDALRERVKLQFRPEEKETGSGETLQVDLCRLNCPKRSESVQTSGAARACCRISPEDFAAIEEEQAAARGTTLSAAGLSYKTLTSTQGTEGAIDNGPAPEQQPERKPRRRSRERGRGAARNRSAAGTSPASGETAAGQSVPEGADAENKPKSARRRRGQRGRRGNGSGGTGGSSGSSADGGGNASRVGRQQPAKPVPDTRVPRRRRNRTTTES